MFPNETYLGLSFWHFHDKPVLWAFWMRDWNLNTWWNFWLFMVINDNLCVHFFRCVHKLLLFMWIALSVIFLLFYHFTFSLLSTEYYFWHHLSSFLAHWMFNRCLLSNSIRFLQHVCSLHKEGYCLSCSTCH